MSKPAVYLGTFIHSKSLTEIDILHDAAIFVDEKGKIVAIEKDIKDVDGALSICPKLGWETDEVIARACGREQFFFPGFIGLSLTANFSRRCNFRSNY
jgi:guanine deaminase